MGMTNAERQKAFRDRKRGAPPKGRWAGHLKLADRAKVIGASRTRQVMSDWIARHAPDVADAIIAGTHPEKTTPAYRRLRGEWDAAVLRLLKTGDLRDRGYRMAMARRDGQFVAEWVRE